MRSPRCPKLRQDRAGVAADKGVEGPLRHGPGLMVEGWQHCPTAAATTGQPFLFGGNPVGLSAGRTSDQICRHIHLTVISGLPGFDFPGKKSHTTRW
jgi:hypothetical protein